ncbi:MAG: PSD1 and planctomycete cytochrome C domain-containing protein, partial [Gemmataceae bacterium]
KCHGGRETEGEFDISDRDLLLKGGAAGPAIIAGRAKDSYLYKLITHQREPHMPHQRRQLDKEQIAHIADWIDLGAPYDKPLVEKKNVAQWTDKKVDPEARQHWAFQPLKRVEPPQVKDDKNWARTPLDRFVLARLQEKGLQPNAHAERRTLIRRAYFDLLGLPPTPAEVEAFVKDDSPDAYGKLIDRLLANPHHGERWARHWLDLARFAESHGFEHDTDRPSAYHYRDFVIQALNEDLPYDTFVKWQLAGDEFAPDNNLALTATGFLAAGVHSTQITANEVEKHRYDELDDMLNTIGTSMLGLTVGCARCHDHKFDPIPQADYYRMLATFTTTVRSEIDLNTDPAGHKIARAAFDKEHAPLLAAERAFETEKLPARLQAWETRKELPAWTVLDVSSSKSAGGAAFKKLDDGSLLVSGKNAKFDAYTLQATTPQAGIRALRIEALSDPSLVKGGPGRAKNGNFALTNLRVTARPAGAKDGDIPVKLTRARATFEQKGLPVAAVIDADERSAWAVDPQFGKDQAAVFELAEPIGFPAGTLLTFTLEFKNNDGHSIGRPRLSIATIADADLVAPGLPEAIRRVLATPRDKRDPKAQSALLEWFRTFDPDWQKLHAATLEHLKHEPKPKTVKALISSEGLPAVRLHTQGADFFNESYFLRRGDVAQKDGVARQEFMQVLSLTADGAKHWQEKPPEGWRTSYRRKAMAEWLTDVDKGAGHLLARVIVNRLWQHHLGRGIVATPSDFGTRGEPPTHPELLDYLATELIRNNWRLKPIHKLIMQSAVYVQTADFDEARGKIDRENRWLWHRPVTRLEAEIIRDALLAVSGELDPRPLGPGTLDPNSKRRSIYFTVKRSKLVPMMVVFDAPEALSGVGQRPTTTIAPQALLLLNNPQVRGYSRAFARKIAPDEKTTVADAARAAYLHALARPPAADELKAAVIFINAQTDSYRADKKADARILALADFCQTLLCLNEFVYVD